MTQHQRHQVSHLYSYQQLSDISQRRCCTIVNLFSFIHVRQFLQINREEEHHLSWWDRIRWQLQAQHQFREDEVWESAECLRSIFHISCQLLWQVSSSESDMCLHFSMCAFSNSCHFLIMLPCSFTITMISNTLAIVFEIWAALAARSESIAVLNDSKYVILTLCPISMILC